MLVMLLQAGRWYGEAWFRVGIPRTLRAQDLFIKEYTLHHRGLLIL